MHRLISFSLLSLAVLFQPMAFAEGAKTVLNNESFELALINSSHSNSAYSTGKGIFAGFSAPVYVTEYGITSLAIDGGYGNLGTIEGEDIFCLLTTYDADDQKPWCR